MLRLRTGEEMKRNYQDSTDEELIDRLREGESEIIDYLMNKYKDLVKGKAGTMYILGADREDLIQEGMIGLFKAVRDYDAGRDASFRTFADLCIARQMYTAIQSSNRKKHAPLNSYISLYADVSDQKNDEGVKLLAALGDRSEKSPEEEWIDRENWESLQDSIEKELSSFEKQVLDLHMTGMNYKEIARILDRDDKSTDNALQRIRSKIRKLVAK